MRNDEKWGDFLATTVKTGAVLIAATLVGAAGIGVLIGVTWRVAAWVAG